MNASAAALDRPAIPDVLAEHIEEHGFISLQRRKLLFSPEIPERRLGEHDERLAAHWDGLAVHATASARLAEERLDTDDPWERASAARAWLVFARPSADALIERWKETPPAHAPSWREALRGLPADDLEALVPAARRAALPPVGVEALADALGWNGRVAFAVESARHEAPAVRAAAARVLGLSDGREAVEAALAPLLDDADIDVRRRALWSAALLAPEGALSRARQLVRGALSDPFATRVIGLLGNPEDLDRIAQVAATEEGRPAAFHALADLGTDEAVATLLRLLGLPDDAVQLQVTAALETALGPIPREDREAPARVDEARAHLGTLSLPRGACWLCGLPRPWRGDSLDEPLLWRWRSAVQEWEPMTAWLRREVPDGFFEAAPTAIAHPGV